MGIVTSPESKLQLDNLSPVSEVENLTSKTTGTLKVLDWTIPMLKPPELVRNT